MDGDASYPLDERGSPRWPASSQRILPPTLAYAWGLQMEGVRLAAAQLRQEHRLEEDPSGCQKDPEVLPGDERSREALDAVDRPIWEKPSGYREVSPRPVGCWSAERALHR